MKCGILTYHQIPNFGAVLQAYALCCRIRTMGYECEIIDYQCENIIKRELTTIKFSNPLKNVAYHILIQPHQKKKIKECREFVQEFFSNRQYTRNDINEANKKYDLFVSGSDMIWNLDVNGNDTTFFLDFTEKPKRRISYGSSIGGKWPEYQLNNIRNCLERYNYISVREQDTCQIIKDIFDIPCETVCDPTMLLKTSDWDKLTTSVNDNPYVLVYFPYKDILAAAEKYAEIHHKKLIISGTTYPWRAKHYQSMYSPQEWMSYIKYADAVFTDSYHGLLFSLYFNRPVWTNNKNNRFSSLLKELKLEKCYIENDPEFRYKIDYEECNRAIERIRMKSLRYLQKALGEDEDAC